MRQEWSRESLLDRTEVVMGAPRSHREKVRQEIESVRTRTLESALLHVLRARYLICEPEARLMVHRSLEYLRAEGSRGGRFRAARQVIVGLSEGRGLVLRRDWDAIPQRPTALTPTAGDDLDVWEEQDVPAMQDARLVRMIEEADRCGTTISLRVLALMVPLNRRAISHRLGRLWDQGLYLPVLGSPRSTGGSRTRLGEVLRSAVHDEPVAQLRSRLALSTDRAQVLLKEAVRIADLLLCGQEAAQEGSAMAPSPAEIASVNRLLRGRAMNVEARARLESLRAIERESRPARSSRVTRDHFEAELIAEHDFSPAKARVFVDELLSMTHLFSAEDQKPEELVVWATAADEPAGKQRSACRLVPVRLPYFAEEDERSGDTTSGVKLQKIVRFATAAKAQGGLLTIPDIAYLVGIAPQTVLRILAQAKVHVPSRGREWDIGPGLSHKVRIVKLFIEGYDETQIARRTQHTYQAIGAYLQDFKRIMALADRGLPAAHIRKATGRSRRLVDGYLELYQEMNIPENQWKLNIMRRQALAQEKKRRSPQS